MNLKFPDDAENILEKPPYPQTPPMLYVVATDETNN